MSDLMRRMKSAFVLVAGLIVLSIMPGGVPARPADAQSDQRYFEQTGYRIGNDKFWEFFQHRGAVKSFGFPTSREFTFQGLQVQFFQRAVMQMGPGGQVQTLNLLDDGLMPYTHINGLTLPAADPAVVSASPPPSSPNYSTAIIDFVKGTAVDSWQGVSVKFLSTFDTTVAYGDAFPNGEGPQSLVPLINLELWGAPTSQPARDPNNDNFVYQRFQRRIAHYDEGCKCTQGILLGDALKSIITGENLPPDLAVDASSSALYLQYDPKAANSVKNPERPELAGTNMSKAFEKDKPALAAAPAPVSAPAQQPQAVGSYRAQSPEYGMNMFLWGNPQTTQRDLSSVTQARFGWQKTLFQWRDIEPNVKGKFEWGEADRIVQASTKAGVKIIGRLDFQPGWARADGQHNGPPDNYQDYADFVKAFVEHYKPGSPNGEVQAIEIWNEPNLDREWGNATINRAQAADYVRLLKGAYTAAKQANPNITIITAGLSPTCTNTEQARPDDTYLQWLYDAGAAQYFDVLGAHGAGYDKPPSASTQESIDRNNGCPVFTFRRVEDLRNVMVKNGDGNKQVWLLEFGWTTDTVHPEYSWFAITPDTHAQYLVDAYLWAKNNWSPWIGVMTLWNMPDPSWGPDREEYWWGVTNPDGSPRPAFQMLSQARKSGPLQ